jgi:triacylglycerol lipase
MTSLRVLETARAVVRVVGRAAPVLVYEVGALASTAATASLCLVGGGVEPASSGSPHTKAHVAPAARPVLLVHGFGGTTSSWSVIARALSNRGMTVDMITYRRLGNSVEKLADELVAAVERTLSQTGADKVHLVGHSLGVSSSLRPSQAAAWSGWSTPSLPWAPRSGDRPGRACCRSGICSGHCDQVQLCCAV